MKEQSDGIEFADNKEEINTCIDALVELLSSLPKSQVQLLIISRYILMAQTAACLQQLLVEADDEGRVEIHLIPEFAAGEVSTELDMLTVYDCAAFTKIILPADNFEIIPLVNGRVRFSITFHSVFRSIDRKKNTE